MGDSSSRRDFLKGSLAATAVAGGAGACMCGLAGGCSSTPKAAEGSFTIDEGKLVIELAKVAELGAVGGFVTMTAKGLPETIGVVRSGEAEYAALSTKCTHFGMGVAYNHESGQMRCGSFGHSTFALDGKVLGGPAKKPLKTYPAAVQDGVLTITL
jgi:cytochrome b6-f complex iron-sulfur subunit